MSNNYNRKIDKKELKAKLKKYVHAMKFYNKTMAGKMLKIESQRYLEDHFTYEERQYLKIHCPIFVRLRLLMLGAYVI